MSFSVLAAISLVTAPATPLDRLERYLSSVQNVEFTLTYQAQGFAGSETILMFGGKGQRAANMRLQGKRYSWVATPEGSMEVDHSDSAYALRSWTNPLPSLDLVPAWGLPDFMRSGMIAEMRGLKPKRQDATTLVWERESEDSKLLVTLVVDASGAPKSYTRAIEGQRDGTFTYNFSSPRPLAKGAFPALLPPSGYTPNLHRFDSLLPGPGDQLPPAFAKACGLGDTWRSATGGKTTLFWLSQADCPITTRVLGDASWQRAAQQAGVTSRVIRLTPAQFRALIRLGFDLPGTPYGMAIGPDGTILGAYAGFGKQFQETIARLRTDLAAKFNASS